MDTDQKEAVVEFWAAINEPFNGEGWYWFDRSNQGYGGHGAFASRELAEADVRAKGFRVGRVISA